MVGGVSEFEKLKQYIAENFAAPDDIEYQVGDRVVFRDWAADQQVGSIVEIRPPGVYVIVNSLFIVYERLVRHIDGLVNDD